ncbi:DUF4974 domain-containing protein [Ilyomonas limi]|uniref:DUF4974 domain-containing protein n=1 Tax=Ilyomonas limi TaxID=2575867 RepID=A0A4U3LB32_9BACT|nr:FecR domain-containing protein [Ilyomonas limi]TKK71017.1 DUF4974 domain-containing protein [Ilyomonas limi]
MHNKNRILQLLEKQNSTGLSAAEEAELDELTASGDEYLFSSDEEKEAIRQVIHHKVFAAIDISSSPIRRIRFSRKMYGYVAAACILAVVGILYWANATRQPGEVQIAAANAVLKSVLPDGSTIWLNKQSAVRYHEDFAEHRNIEITKGEVFFEVKKDAVHPFVVHAAAINTTVKGTSFSVKMLPRSGDVKVSVVTGRVAVSKAKDTLSVLLPHQRLKYHAGSKQFNRDSVSVAEANGWIDGDIVLEKASIAELADWLQTAYNISVINQTAGNTRYYYVHLSSTTSLDDAISILNLLVQQEHARFQLQGNTIILKPL